MKQGKKKVIKGSTPVSKVKKESIPSKNGLTIENFFSRYGFQVFISLLFIIIFIVFYDFIILKKVYLFKDIGSDSINIYLPYWVHISDYLRAEGIPQWSHQVGMGQSIYMFDMGNPFS